MASLKASFTRLFLVPGASFVHPWESPYIGKEVMLFQESTLDVRHRYAAYGFAAAEFGHFPEDHVSMMLDFLGNGDERYHAAHNGILAAIEQVIASGPKTPDMKGSASTQQVSDAICKAILA